MLLPTYNASCSQSKVQDIGAVTLDNLPAPFKIPRTTVRKTAGEVLTPASSLQHGRRLVEQANEHRRQTGAKCMCVLVAEDVWRAVGEIKSGLQEESDPQGPECPAVGLKVVQA
jgi:hypothetical protein